MAAPAIHHVPGQSFSPERLEARKRTLGASEVPAVLGLDKYRGPYDVWATKRGLVPPFPGNPFTEWGLRVEPVIRQKVAEVLDTEITLSEGDDPDQPGTLVHPVEQFLSCTPDGLLEYEGEPAILQIKSKTARQVVHWGESMTSDVPTDVTSQVFAEMIVTGRRRALVAVLFDKADFRLYPLQYDAEAADLVLDRCRDFWFKHVVPGTQPEIDGTERTAEALRARFAQLSDTFRQASRGEDELLLALSNVRVRQGRDEEEEQRIKNLLMSAIGTDAGLVGRNGRISWKQAKDSRHVDWQAAFNDLWNRVAVGSDAATMLAELVTREALVDQFTTTRPGVRPFRVTFPKTD